jgi:molybdopterin-synthase adenylyltransferase
MISDNSNINSIFSRQLHLPQIGPDGQHALLCSHVAIVGAGAVGSRIAELLCRTGVGRLTLIDNDSVEYSNLPRQTLYTWADAEKSIHKAEAARRALNCIMPACQVFPKIERLNKENIDMLLGGAHVVSDGTDNVETRYLINDWCVENGVPWVYAGAAGTKASVFPIVRKDANLRSVFPDPPDKVSVPTALEVGIIAAAPSMAAVRASTLILRILLNDMPEPIWETWDVWIGQHSFMSIDQLKESL